MLSVLPRNWWTNTSVPVSTKGRDYVSTVQPSDGPLADMLTINWEKNRHNLLICFLIKSLLVLAIFRQLNRVLFVI